MYEQSIIVAILQGVMEFLPVSSSGHLIAMAEIFGFNDKGIITDVVVHFGTLFAVLFYMRKDIPKIVQEGISFSTLGFRNIKTNNFYIVFIGSLPIIICGFLFYDDINDMFRNNDDVLKFIGYSSIIFGLVIFFIDKTFSYFNSIKTIGILGIILIGIFQILSLIPGVSRSGSIIAGSRFMGINRTDTAKISFLLSIPAILGAMTLVLIKNFSEISAFNSNEIKGLLIAFGVSFIVGLAVINMFINWAKKHDFTVFVIYRIIFGGALLLISYNVI